MEPQKKTIAIVDKNVALADLIGEIAQEDMGFEVHKMTVGRDTKPQDVASFVQEVSPSLILLAENYQDLTTTLVADPEYWPMIKQGEGIEALAEIRRRGVTAPVYMVSSAPRHYERAMQEGADGYISVTGDTKKLTEFLESSMR